MQVTLKYGHHNGDRFYHAGEILDCDKKLFHLLVKQGLAIPVKEESPKKENAPKNPDESGSQAENGQNSGEADKTGGQQDNGANEPSAPNVSNVAEAAKRQKAK